MTAQVGADPLKRSGTDQERDVGQALRGGQALTLPQHQLEGGYRTSHDPGVVTADNEVLVWQRQVPGVSVPATPAWLLMCLGDTTMSFATPPV